jgi:hypothetical protein
MKRRIAGALAALALLAGAPAVAGPNDQAVVKIYGFGDLSCAQWNKAKGAERRELQSWFYGFISGTNYVMSVDAAKIVDVVGSTPLSSVMMAIEDHCRASPGGGLLVTATDIVKGLLEIKRDGRGKQ